MITGKLQETSGGWFVGDFEDAVYKTTNFEASLKIHKKGEQWETHFHRFLDEINLVISGRIRIQGQEFSKGDIFVMEPNEISDPVFLEDCVIVCLKSPRIRGDKVVV